MSTTKEVTANELHTLLTTGVKAIDIGPDKDQYRKAVEDLREAGHTILVGPTHKTSENVTSQTLSMGQSESTKSTVEL